MHEDEFDGVALEGNAAVFEFRLVEGEALLLNEDGCLLLVEYYFEQNVRLSYIS